jgi:F-type H+-transporting ATPase subunit O
LKLRREGRNAKKDQKMLIMQQALDNKTLSRLEAAVTKSQYVANGQKLKVVSKVNPEIKGGLIVEIGDRTIDLSVSSKMAKMNKLLKDTL